MSPSGSAEMEGTYWHAMLKLIHLDHGCVPVCLGARGSQGYWQSCSLQRAQVISMLSLPFETWFPYSLSAKVTRLGETASRLALWKATSKPFLEFFSLFLRSFSLSLSVSATVEVGRGGGVFWDGGFHCGRGSLELCTRARSIQEQCSGWRWPHRCCDDTALVLSEAKKGKKDYLKSKRKNWAGTGVSLWSLRH